MQPTKYEIYHIVHIDKLKSIIYNKALFSDFEVRQQSLDGTTIGMDHIKQRRLTELTLKSHPDLYVGQCVPFYFCPRSVMLYMIHANNDDDLTYNDGQDNIVHLEIDFNKAVQWACANSRRWAFTGSNAGSKYFDDTNDITNISKLDWSIINSNYWSASTDKKQAEFLCEHSVSWDLIERIGVNTQDAYHRVENILKNAYNKPKLEIMNDWYY